MRLFELQRAIEFTHFQKVDRGFAFVRECDARSDNLGPSPIVNEVQRSRILKLLRREYVAALAIGLFGLPLLYVTKDIAPLLRINSLLAATPIFLIGAVPYIAFLFHRRRTVRKMVDGLPTIQVARSPEEQAAVSSLRYWSGLAPTLLGLAMAWVWLAAWHNDAGHLWIAVACAALVLILDTVRRSRLLAPIRNWNPFDYPKPPQV